MDLEFRGRWDKDPGAGELHLEVHQHLYDIKAKRLDEITRRLSFRSEEMSKPCFLGILEFRAQRRGGASKRC